MEHVTFVPLDEREKRPTVPLTRYGDDAHAWTMQRAGLLKAGRFADLDLVNLADEVVDVGHREYDESERDLAGVLQHLLKWDRQPALRSRSWADTVKEHRRLVARQLRRFPSLKSRLVEALDDAYERGRGDALIEAGLPDSILPDAGPCSWDEP